MDPLPFVRNHMIAYISDLLKEKPEQEQLLLRLLVNKLVNPTASNSLMNRVTDLRRSLQKPPTSYSNLNQPTLK